MFNRKSRKDLEEEIKVLRERLGVESRRGKSLTVDVYLLTGKLKEAGDAYERGFLEGLDFEDFVMENEELEERTANRYTTFFFQNEPSGSVDAKS